MQTNFTLAQLADSDIAAAETILRTCVHCGFCLATCPTYVLDGNELDSPRGRIYQIKDMLERGGPVAETTVEHIDRCLSCLSCMTTCPSGVHYMHLVDHARAHIEQNFRRSVGDRLLRRLLNLVLPRPGLFRLSLFAAVLARPLLRLPGVAGLVSPRLAGLIRFAPRTIPPPSAVDRVQVCAAEGPRRYRVALLTGCAQQVLAPEINEATVRLLCRLGVEVVVADSGCCGGLSHHLGQVNSGLALARRNIAAWIAEMDGPGLDAVIINTSGCGTTVKDYGFMFRDQPEWAGKAARVAAITRDVTEFLVEHDFALERLGPPRVTGQVIAYHAACSLQHGQRTREPPKLLLRRAGFTVRDIPDAHLCCGSAGTYNLLQPNWAGDLRQRKVAAIASTTPDAVAAGNIGCIEQIGSATTLPVVHTVALLDWATGGPLPAPLTSRAAFLTGLR
ncbi:MAG: glycolate oxidase subunit GlcF [Azospirillaceae bacterium]|nr:glycolate oxidase subunit GlcF [Azospirillaceae bacterium]